MHNIEAEQRVSLKEHLAPILELLQRQELEEALTRKQTHGRANLVENLLHRQQEAELQRKLAKLASADIAYLLEMLPIDKRVMVWHELDDVVAGMVLLELSDGVIKGLLEQTQRERLQTILTTLDAEDLAEIAQWISAAELTEVKQTLESRDRNWLEETLKFPDDTVGSIMSKDSLIARDDMTIDDAIEVVRKAPTLPHQTDKLFVINRTRQLVGTVSLTELLRHDGKQPLKSVMVTNIVSFYGMDDAAEAAQAFERYDLISVPVIDERKRIKGRLTVEAVMDYVREFSEYQVLVREGLHPNSDLFGPVVESAKERWPWLFINLCTAFVASRFIGFFESTIQQLVALATLMPIVASMGGNTGNQTVALFVRALALNQLHAGNLKFIISKEIFISLLNGVVWGSILGLFTLFLYQNWILSLVMMVAVLINLLLAAVVGILIPILLDRFDKDPALGSSVMLTFMTDSMGFVVFLGLAALFVT